MCDNCKWLDYLNLADELLDQDEEYGYAEETIRGIREWVNDNEHVTDNQINALNNIESKPSNTNSWGFYGYILLWVWVYVYVSDFFHIPLLDFFV